MARRKRYQPQLDVALEPRVVLSQLGPRAALISTRAVGAAVQKSKPNAKIPPVVARINLAFDSFQRDFNKARDAYLASLESAPLVGTPAQPATQQAFVNYTRYRVDLLAQQLSKSFFHLSSNSKLQQQHNETSLRFTSLVSRRINGVLVTQNNNRDVITPSEPFRIGTLGRALIEATPNAVGTSDSAHAANTLNVLAQNQAIDAAQAAIINGYNFVKATSLSGNQRK